MMTWPWSRATFSSPLPELSITRPFATLRNPLTIAFPKRLSRLPVSGPVTVPSDPAARIENLDCTPELLIASLSLWATVAELSAAV